MALINLQTKYTSLKFSQDQKGGGYSGQPYVKFNNSGSADVGGITIKADIGTLVDFPIRGGTYPSREIDTQRIKAFLNDPVKGKVFLDKQRTLQFTNPKMETGPSFIDSYNSQTLPGIVENTRVYSVDNLLGQVKIQGTGGHLTRVGSVNFGARDQYYADTVGFQNISNDAVNNRLLLLTKLKISNMTTAPTTVFNVPIIDLALAKSLGISITANTLFNYPGGPNSGYQSGNTVIKRAFDTTINLIGSNMTYAQIAQQTPVKGSKDFTKTQPYTNKKSMQNRIGVYNVSALSGSRNDVINSLYPQAINPINGDDPYKIMASILKIPKTDSIKFGFECVDNDHPNNYVALIFRVLLSNGFTDSNSAVLNSFRYYGRGEEFYTYQGFSRSISFSFKVAAFSASELQPLYNKLNYLISQVYPDYSTNGNQTMRAPLVKITLGDYLYRVPGFLENVNITVDNSIPWEINIDDDPSLQELPHVLDVSITFKPIHDILPSRSTPDSITNLITNGTKQGFLQSKLRVYDAISKINQQTPTPTPITPITQTPIPEIPL